MSKFHNWIKKYFIPHGENHYEPHFLRHESMLMVFLAIIIIELAFLVQIFIVFDKTNFLASVLPGVLTTLTNEKRAQNNAGPLTQNELLNKAAQLKAEDMAINGYFAHTSPEGKTPWYWFEQVGYKYSSAGENLAVNFFESNDVAEAWMNSPSHRDNIVKQAYTEIGIGVANGVYKGRNTVFVAQLFGTPVKTLPPATPPVTAPTTITKPATTSPTPVVKPKPATSILKTKPVPAKTPAPTPAPQNVAPSSGVVVAPVATEVLGEEAIRNTASIANSIISPFKISIQKILASPRQSVAFVYTVIAIIIMSALLLVFFIVSELRHPLIMLRGLGLVSVIILLLFVNIKMIPVETSIASDDLTSGTIAR